MDSKICETLTHEELAAMLAQWSTVAMMLRSGMPAEGLLAFADRNVRDLSEEISRRLRPVPAEGPKPEGVK